MNKNDIILSDVGVLFGVIGTIFVLFPLINIKPFFGTLYNGIISLIFGVIGFILIFSVSKRVNDDITKLGFVLNTISIFWGLFSIIVYSIR